MPTYDNKNATTVTIATVKRSMPIIKTSKMILLMIGMKWFTII